MEPGHLGEAQTGLYGQQNEGVITPARPRTLIRSSQQGIDFGACEELDQGSCGAFIGDGEHPLDLCGIDWYLESCKTKERAQSRQAQIAAASADALLLLQVIQKRHDQGRIDLLEVEP